MWLINWLMDLLPIPPMLKEVWRIATWLYEKLKLVVGFLWAFPFVGASWEVGLWQSLIWMLWLFLLTQPKFMDKTMNGVAGVLEVPAKMAFDGLIWPVSGGKIFFMIIVCPLLFPPLQFLYGFAIIFKSWSIKDKKIPLGRIAITLSLLNFLSSEYLMKATIGQFIDLTSTPESWIYRWLGWLIMAIIPAGLILAYLLLFREPEYVDEARDAFKKKGYFLGFFYLLIQDFLPEAKFWKCPQGHKNPVKDNPGADEKCRECGLRNPASDWECCGVSHSIRDKHCTTCGKANPHRQTVTPTEVTCQCGFSQPAGDPCCGNCGSSLGGMTQPNPPQGGQTPPPAKKDRMAAFNCR